MYKKLKQERIRQLRKRILHKLGVTLPILMILFSLCTLPLLDQPPEDWTTTEIVFSHISHEHTGIHRGDNDVLNTQDGRKFDIRTQFVSLETLQKELIPGETYRITYSGHFLDVPRVEAIGSTDTVYQTVEPSVEWWELGMRKLHKGILCNLAAEILALILVDRLWCRKEHLEIKKQKRLLENG